MNLMLLLQMINLRLGESCDYLMISLDIVVRLLLYHQISKIYKISLLNIISFQHLLITMHNLHLFILRMANNMTCSESLAIWNEYV